MRKISDMIHDRKTAVLGSAAVLLLAGAAWGLSTQPLVPRSGPAGSAGSTGSSPAVMGSVGPGGTAAPAGHGHGHAESENDDRQPDEKDESGKEDPAAEGAAVDGGKPGGAAGDAPGGKSQATSKPSSDPGQSQQKPSGPVTQMPSKPSGGSPSGQAPSKPAEKPAAPQKPQHAHDFQPVYRDEPVYGQQWVSNWVDVYTRHERYVCNGCGAAFPTTQAYNQHSDSLWDWDKMAYVDGVNHGTYLDDSYTTKEQVDQGSYQQVQTGTKQVLDHYECSCGARK